MKNRYQLTIILIVISLCTQAQVATINDLFQKKLIFQRDFHHIASGYQTLLLNQQHLASLRNQLSQQVTLNLPFEGSDLSLELTPVVITSKNFSVIQGSVNGNHTVSYTLPSFYQGKIKDADKSFATISLSDNQVMGLFSDSKSNIILGSIEQNGQATNEYSLYRDADLKVNPGITCFTSDSSVSDNTEKTKISSARELATGQPVEIYFECDYKFYQDKGSNINNVVNYVLGFFNNVALLYAREDIMVQVSQIKVWTTPDPYTALTSTSSILTSFGNNMANDPYSGDYAHFLSTRSLGGGVAYRSDNPCLSRQYRTAVSAINNTYQNFPTYSWTVNVVTHELGHNFGSPHTHWCGWVGGPIDGCGPTANASYAEGTCTTGPLPAAGGGTIMSYCHLLNAVRINLSNGFGQQPGDKIRSVIGASACFGNCKMTASLVKNDASCGQNNGSIAITPANGTGVYTYLWSNGETGSTLSNAAPGIYNVIITDAAGCKITDNDTIVNAGGTLTLNLTPATASICRGNDIVLSATNNPSYTYKWYKNSVLINGATQANYTVTSGGIYAVEATSGTCVVTKTLTVAEVTQPVAIATAAGPVNFCTGGSVLLNASPSTGYQYQWYRGGTAIGGATTNSYSATTTGSYTVRVYSGSCESYSSAINVTIVSAPNAIITAGGPLSFCQGSNVALTASSGTGYSYQWYRNNTIINGASQINHTAATSGSYTVVSTLGTCSKTSSATTVTVFANPSIVINPDSSAIEKFETQTLTASGAATYNWSAQPGFVSAAINSVTVKPLTTTVYTIDGVDNNGCRGTTTAKIVVIGCGDATNITATAYSPSRVLLTWNNPEGASGDTIQYRVNGEDEWKSVYSDENEIELNGLIPGKEYEYRIIALCNTTETFISSNINSFNTPALSSGIYIKLFPNPAKESSRVEIIADKTYTLQIDLFNQAGQRIKNISPAESIAAGQTIKSINTETLAPGLYHLLIGVNDKVYNKKMIIQK